MAQLTLKLETRRQRQIENSFDQSAVTAGLQKQVDDYRAKYMAAIHRTQKPCTSYNCHGLTFASRRSAIYDVQEINKIISDDGYDLIDRKDVLPGDIVIYARDGDAEHSGVIIEKTLLNFRVLSKWGYAQEVVHFLTDCPYNASDVKFYRLND